MKRTFLFVFPTIVVILFGSCSKENEESKVNNIPMNELLSSETLKELEQHMPIYNEYTPPVIEGTFYLHPTYMKYSSIPGDENYLDGNFNFYDCLFTFSRKSSEDNSIKVTLEEIDEDGEVSTTSSSNEKAYIYGSGNNFSIYNEMIEKNSSGNITSKSLCVISGTKTTKGITNLNFSVLMLEKDDPDDDYIDVNDYRLFCDGDGLATDTITTRSTINRATNKLIWDKNRKSLLHR